MLLSTRTGGPGPGDELARIPRMASGGYDPVGRDPRVQDAADHVSAGKERAAALAIRSPREEGLRAHLEVMTKCMRHRW